MGEIELWFNYNKAKAHPVGSAGTGMAFLSCPELGGGQHGPVVGCGLPQGGGATLGERASFSQGQFSQRLSAQSHPLATLLAGEGISPLVPREEMGSTTRQPLHCGLCSSLPTIQGHVFLVLCARHCQLCTISKCL